MKKFIAVDVEGDGLMIRRIRREAIAPDAKQTPPLNKWGDALQSIVLLNGEIDWPPLQSVEVLNSTIDWPQVAIDFAAWLQCPEEAEQNFKARREGQ